MRALVVAACLLMAALGCGGRGRSLDESEARPRPHVVLVSLDTLHVDWTGPYNEAVETTPFLDRLAAKGTRFARAYTQVPITLPSHASIMTGMSPQTLGVFANGDTVPASAATLAETLKAAGYRTAAFPSLGVLRPAFGLDQGFDHYPDPFEEGPPRWYRTAEEMVTPAVAWLEANVGSDVPLFMWLHLSDPHEPYLPVGAPPDTELLLDGESVGRFSLVGGERFEQAVRVPPGNHRLRFASLREPSPDDRPETAIVLNLASSESLDRYAVTPAPGRHPLQPDFAIELENAGPGPVEVTLVFSGVLERPTPADVLPHYETEVAYTDEHLQKLDEHLERLGIVEQTLVVVVSDHGEGLFRHDFLGHTTHVYEDQLRVLWLMRGPGVPPGRVLDEAAARLTDVTPTLLDLIGSPARESASFEGRSWAPCLRGDGCPTEEPFWAFGLEHDPRQVTMMAAYDGRYKWIWQRALGRSAYDLASDPRESDDLLREGGPHNPEPLKKLAESFPDVRRALNEAVRAERVGPGPGAETEAMLESLGYIVRPK